MDNLSIGKIPTNDENKQILDFDTDKVKILELSNDIDKWEQEVLFADNGFFSIKGKEIENKSKEFYGELKNYINLKILDLHLKKAESVELAGVIKNKKLDTIKQKMEDYEKNELLAWENQVFEDAIKSAITRAVLYKNDEQIVLASKKNALAVIELMAKKQSWNKKSLLSKINQFEQEFYLSLIEAFLADNNIKAVTLFNKIKEKLSDESVERLDTALKLFKNKIIAYNWAQELFSYNLLEEENKKEISKIEDKEIQNLASKFISDFKSLKEKEKTKNAEEKNEKNWQQIVEIVSENIEEATLYIDTSLDISSQNSKQKYIDKMRKNGYVSTDSKKFVELIKESISDFQKFKDKNISDYRETLSLEDFELISELKEMKDDEYMFFVSDFNYIQSEISENELNNSDKFFNLIKSLFIAKKNYQTVNKKSLDIEANSKLIKLVVEQYKNNKTEGEVK